MINIVLAFVFAAATFAALSVPHVLSAYEAIVPTVLVLVVSYIFLARRIFRQLEVCFAQSAQFLQVMPPKFDAAIASMERAYALVPWQLGIRSQIDTQIGVVYFLQKEFSRALPYLERSLVFGHWMGGAMLGVVQYKKKNYPQMHKTFQVLTKRAKKQSLVWCLYAYLLTQLNDADRAISVLKTGARHAGSDPRIKENLLALQNGKKMKMRGYKEQWYQFHLERPPAVYQQQANGAPQRMSRASRRGRW